MKNMSIRIRRFVLQAGLLFLAACLLVCAAGEGVVQETANVTAAAAPGLEVYFFDLGRVDGILIRCEGETAFIDVGFESDAKQAIRYLNALGIDRLKFYIGTHGHEDHIKGAPQMIEAMRPERIYISHLGCLNAILDNCDEAQKQAVAASERVILQPEDTFSVGSAKFTCLGPLEVVNCPTGNFRENYNSLILRMDYGQRSMLFTGDTTDGVLREVALRFPGMLNVDVLKNPHHNGAHDEDILRLIAPQMVVFCTDDENLPKESYIQLLNDLGVRSFLTGKGLNGNVVLLSDGESIEVRCGYTAAGVTLDPIPDLYVGQELALPCRVEGNEGLSAERHLGYNSSNEAVAIAMNGRVLAVAQGSATITAVSINGISASAEVRVYDAVVTLDQSELRMAVGEKAKLSGRVLPEGAKADGEWICEDESVARFSDGIVTAVGEGETHIVARLANGAEAVCNVIVRGMIAKSVKVKPDSATMEVGDTLSLSATVKPEGYNPDDLEWESSDDSVLWVDGYGNVTAVRKGKAKITVTASEGVRDVCTIRVK